LQQSRIEATNRGVVLMLCLQLKRSRQVRVLILVVALVCMAGGAIAQTTGDSARARLRAGAEWSSGRLVRFDSILVLRQLGQDVQLARRNLVQVQVYRRTNPVLAMVIGTGMGLAGYGIARSIAGSNSEWACHGCGITWSEPGDYLLFGSIGLGAGLIAHAILPKHWKTIFRQ
jgi:hypothetical protein